MFSNVLPLQLKQTFLPIIWIFTEGEGDGIKSRLPFKIFSTLSWFRSVVLVSSFFQKINENNSTWPGYHSSWVDFFFISWKNWWGYQKSPFEINWHLGDYYFFKEPSKNELSWPFLRNSCSRRLDFFAPFNRFLE